MHRRPARRPATSSCSRCWRANVEVLNGVKAKKIVATCPHCLHTLGNEYRQLGGDYEVVHHTQLLTSWSRQGG